MNKQEKLFNWIDDNTGQGISDGKLYFNMFVCEPNAIKNKIKDLLNDSQNVKVPPCVDGYINFCMHLEMTLTEALTKEKMNTTDCFKFVDEALDWLESPINQDIFADAWLRGWEVKEEPKWKIINDQKYCLTSIEAGYGNSLHWAFDSTKKKPILFDNEETALYTAYITGGTVEKV